MAYTPGAQAAVDAVNNLINNSWSAGQTKSGEITSKSSAMLAAISGYESAIDALVITPTDVPAVSITPVPVGDASGVASEQSAAVSALTANLVTAIADFKNTHFPGETTASSTLATWVSSTMTNPSPTIPTNVATLDAALNGFISSPSVDSSRTATLNAWLVSYIQNPAISLSSDLATLNGQLSTFIADPSVTSAGVSSLISTLSGYIATPETPMADFVIGQLWEKARAQVTTEMNRAVDSVAAIHASRRFPLPSGAMAGQILQLQQGSQDKMAEIARDSVIKASDLAYDKIKFSIGEAKALHATMLELSEGRLKMAVTQAQTLRQSLFDAVEKRLALCIDAAKQLQLQLVSLDLDKLKMAVDAARALRGVMFDAQERRLSHAVDLSLSLRKTAMDSALDYIKSHVSAYDVASKSSGLQYDLSSRMTSAAASYFNAQVAAAEATTKVGIANASNKIEAGKTQLNAKVSYVDARMKAYVTEINAISHVAASLYNNLHGNAGISYSVNGT